MIDWHPFSLSVRDEIIDKWRRRYDMIWRDETYGNDVLSCDDRGLAGHGNDRIKIACCQRVGKIAKIVGKKCAD